LQWERVRPGGKAPGFLKNISLAEANGMIYVFGTNSEKISVLWKYNTRKKYFEERRIIFILYCRESRMGADGY